MTTPSALDIARDLIRCPSVTPDDKGALGVIETLLQGAGFETHRIVFKEEGWPDIGNLYARIGAGHPHLTFAGHTDVVPPGAAADWRFDPFSAEVAEGMLWGRGAVDMKGGIAASYGCRSGLYRTKNERAERRDIIPHHWRRRGPRRKRHDQAAAMGA